MADLSQTAANVKQGTGATTQQITYGGTVTQGMPVYKDANDSNQHKAGDCTTSAATAAIVGVAITPGVDEDKGFIVTAGPVNIGATLTVGEIYVLSESGAICPEADLTTDDYVTVLGVAISSSLLQLDINVSGVQVP